MSIVDTTVRDFGQTMGMKGLAFNDAGVVRLRFENAGVLSIERTSRGALVCLARPVGPDSAPTLQRALELCHFDEVDRLRPDVGMARDGSLVFSLALNEKAIDVPALEDAFDLLCRLHDRAAGVR
jgi:type III secretion system chaperone SycN